MPDFRNYRAEAKTKALEGQRHIAAVADLIAHAKSEGRGFTLEEAKAARQNQEAAALLAAEATQLVATGNEKAADSAAFLKSIEASDDEINDHDDDHHSLGLTGTKGGQTRSFGTESTFGTKSWADGKSWAKDAAKRFQSKALITGSVTIGAVSYDIVDNPQQAKSFLELLPAPLTLTAPMFSYMRQVARDNQAGVVADGQQKPTSNFSLQEVTDRARVIAHLTEPFSERLLADYPQFVQWLETEMREGVLQAWENEILNGDGTGEHYKGVLSTSGVGAQAFTTDLVTTLRKARTKMQKIEEKPTAWVFNPDDLETIELIRENGATGPFIDLDHVLGKDIARVTSTKLAPGQALLGDWTKVQPLTREEVNVKAFNGDKELFGKNLVQVRGEQRGAYIFERPQAVTVVDLAA